ncbi:flavin-containing monooxygenase [Nocardia stercoris]|uniref:NAD(P)/FAD-dependent oxidoreductase n=1 Tax=Nocardia stercoris TaxID=2483361 RepID=A0A3M2LE61_9NOCA|nr:NAD(P)/FAD-dependent oxidoreductase [Nocardia stercoris]RMI35050.1 NAD(P)/FAD-dependent oxidoreductase [Nocardia stercoris]
MSRKVTDKGVAAKQKAAAGRSVRHSHIIVLGSGFSGMGLAVRLIQQGRKDFLVLERGSDVGGTWRDNTYPGAACDVPSHLYSYSFELNPGWSRSFSKQAEIQAYIQGVADKYSVRDRHIFDCDVQSARWNGETSQWEIETTQGAFTADFVVSAVGALCEPNLPNIKGIEDFAGDIFHSARWDHEANLDGKKVAVIGTGASAIQIVPSIAGEVEHLDVYQRTAPWLLPRMDRAYTGIEKWAFKNIPGFQRLSRSAIYAARETQVVGLAKAPILMKGFEAIARAKLFAEIRDAELRAKVTPNFRIGCKRMLISNEYYPALDRDNVDVVTDPIVEVTEKSIITGDGTEREIDAIIVATGFHVTDSPMYEHIVGADGSTMAEQFDRIGQQGYKGAAIENFPNMFFMLGPNVGLGHTSMVFMIESQINYIADALKVVDRQQLGTVSVKPEAVRAYNAELHKKLEGAVWSTGGCASWYLDKHGNNTTLWPDFTFRFREITKNFDADAYTTTKAS